MATLSLRRVLVALSCVAILAGAGCGSSSKKSTTSTTTPPATSSRSGGGY